MKHCSLRLVILFVLLLNCQFTMILFDDSSKAVILILQTSIDESLCCSLRCSEAISCFCNHCTHKYVPNGSILDHSNGCRIV